MGDVRVEVRLWGRRVGTLTEKPGGPPVFEYASDFRESGLEISPLHLPLSLQGQVRFDELRERAAFAGLPGVLADSLPDAFGTRVIRAWFAAKGREAAADSPARRLLYVGERAMGALTYHAGPAAREVREGSEGSDAFAPTAPAADAPALDLEALMHDARTLIRGGHDVGVPEIFRIGASAGGMRPKVVVLFNPDTREIRSGFATPEAGEIPAILKLDGAGQGKPTDDLTRSLPFNRAEAAYARLASAAGLDVVGVRVLEVGKYAHLVIPRFDLTPGGQRLHQHTFGGMVHADFNRPPAGSYEKYLRTILALGMERSALEEGYRRMVFNVLAVNQDDHVKNLSFHMDARGAWHLTPAYDLTFAQGSGWTARHQMTVRGRIAEIREEDLLAVAREIELERPGRIIERVREAVAGWPATAAETEVPPRYRTWVEERLRRRDREVFG